MASLSDRAIFQRGKSSEWGLRDILRDKKLKEELSNVGHAFRQRHDQRVGPHHKFTVVRRRAGGFHATGIGFLPLTFQEVKLRARLAGYTHLKMGAIQADLRGIVTAKN